jgi:tripartite ATP-independent transporter DctM subunit
MEPWVVTLIFFASLILLLILGLPVAFTLSGLAIVFSYFIFGPQSLFTIALEAYGVGTDFVLTAVPLFVLMANILERSGLAEDLYNTMYQWLNNIPGGLASGTIVICAIFAAMAGISGVATITMGLIALPSMLERQYEKKLVVGTIMAGGALGILIPPSVIAILYGSITGTSVGKLFIGSIIPGIILSVFFILYITLRCAMNPKLAPPARDKFSWRSKLLSLKALAAPLLLVIAVLGTLYGGVCTPTESAGIGAVGSLICAAAYRKLTWKDLQRALTNTLLVSSMALWIVFGASCFKGIYVSTGASGLMLELVSRINIAPLSMIGVMMAVYFILGALMDPVGMLMLTIPIFLPIVESLGFDPVWFGVLFIVNSEMAYLTPPFGFNLFYMKSITPPSISMTDIYMSVPPFVLVQTLCLVVVIVFPQLILWLPSKM